MSPESRSALSLATPDTHTGRDLAACGLLAAALHGALLGLAVQAHSGAPAHSPYEDLEVVLLEPEAPQPPPPEAHPPASPEPKPKPESKPAPRRTPPRRPSTAATPTPAAAPESESEPAHAGALLTQTDTATPDTDSEPVRFVTDPSGTGYGSGLVARGGRAGHGGGRPGRATRPAEGASAGPVFATTWSRAPRLVAPDACAGHFPGGARAHRGEVSLVVSVLASGRLARSRVERETPTGEGFGAAARACLRGLRFEPALGHGGQPIAARTRIRIHFSR